jgi:hypothetical protein
LSWNTMWRVLDGYILCKEAHDFTLSGAVLMTTHRVVATRMFTASPTLLPSRQSASKLELGPLFAEARTLVFRLKLKSVAVARPKSCRLQPTRTESHTNPSIGTQNLAYLLLPADIGQKQWRWLAVATGRGKFSHVPYLAC